MKQRKHWWEGIGLVLGILLLILVARTLLNAQPPAASEPAESTVTATAIPPSATSEATATATATPTPVPDATAVPAEAAAIPLCSFAVPTQTEPTSESLLDAYVFSEPRVVLTLPNESNITIGQWLPDRQQLLMTQRLPGQARQYVEVFDVQTGEIQRFGEGATIAMLRTNVPVWLEAEQAVAYVDYAIDGQKVLFISRGEGNQIKAATNLASAYLAADSDGKRIVYFSTENQTQPLEFETDRAQTRLLSTNFNLPDRDVSVMDRITHYQIAVRPNKDQIAFYNNSGLYLVNTDNGGVCEIDLGEYSGRKQWALSAHWSPDGRYLAIFVAIGELPVPFNHLIVVDMFTGEQNPINLDNDYLYTLAWAPNSRDFLLLDRDLETEHRHNLHLVDAVTGQTRLMLETYPFMFSAYYGVVWSANSQAIALSCPLVTSPGARSVQEQLCIISVEVNQ